MYSLIKFFEDLDSDWTTFPKTYSYVKETEEKSELNYNFAGYKREEIKLKVEKQYLLITAENKRFGRKTTSYLLGKLVDAAKITAKLEDGILNVKLPLKEEAKPKEIEIKID